MTSREPRDLHLTGDASADELLSDNANALLIGMVLDQQVPMEKAFAGPAVIAERMGGTFDVRAIAAMEIDDFIALCSERPAVHRFPGAMAKRVHQVCQVLAEEYDADAEAMWRTAADGAELKGLIARLPGFGDQKASIFTALLGKQYGFAPQGWREAAGPYGEDGVYRSVADVVDADSLSKVRDFKKSAKVAARAAKAS
ncbi:HhH-GPD-type base excision DNA repair protein [Microlunatus panaciterrae]|uniref:HhH-GPD family protein n=1 Tax=Microlunatus panaciterrae TaxID=400768 RepID=A0ABS2RDT1_9ACTN|nr:HhH-GPD-type base excision DNA repair protein [Microlunatus panaciterrae]MBM7797154.1 putative HhH-GPD family protein [Microlunatus panaciterrae]